jgi:hypothetical protein
LSHLEAWKPQNESHLNGKEKSCTMENLIQVFEYSVHYEFIIAVGEDWRTFFKACAQIVDNFERSSFACPWEL